MTKVHKAGRVQQAAAHQKWAKAEVLDGEYTRLQAALDRFTEYAANESGAPMALLASALTRYLGDDDIELVTDFAHVLKGCAKVAAQAGKSRTFDPMLAAQ